jgi:hypothetical protein
MSLWFKGSRIDRTRESSPPPYWPSVTLVGAPRHEIVKGKNCKQQCTNGDWHNQETPRQVVDNNDKWIDPGRRMKCIGQD